MAGSQTGYALCFCFRSNVNTHAIAERGISMGVVYEVVLPHILWRIAIYVPQKDAELFCT